MGSLYSDDGFSRSEVQVDRRNAYDAFSAAQLFTQAGPCVPVCSSSVDSPGFPAITVSHDWTAASGLQSTSSTEDWVVCHGADPYAPTANELNCPSFDPAGIELRRTVAMSNGGRVVMLTDTWTSINDAPHTLDLLYDTNGSPYGNHLFGAPGYRFPGQRSFGLYSIGQTVPGPSFAPGSVLVRSDVTAPDGDPEDSVGAITFSAAPTGFVFANGTELEARYVLRIPASGSVTLRFVCSIAYTVAAVQSLALDAEDLIVAPALKFTAPKRNAKVHTLPVRVAGTAIAGSGVSSLLIDGRRVRVGRRGAFVTRVRLKPGRKTITGTLIDAAGAHVRARVTVRYRNQAAGARSTFTPRQNAT